MKYYFGLILLITILLLSACKEDNVLSKKVDFDRKALLTNYAQNIIPINYNLLYENIVALDTTWTHFKKQPNEVNLQLLRLYFVEAYKAWQNCSVFEFGPAEQMLLRANLNTFPTDTFKIGNNIRNANYDLSAASNLDAKGLPALDYLFFKHADAIGFLSDSTNQLYINELIVDIKSRVNFVNAWWNDNSSKDVFISKDGVDIGSSVGLLVNQINYDLELLKTAKLGIPLGKKTMGVTLPNMVEGYYSGISKELLLLNINSIKNAFAGNVNHQITGIGLDDYLKAVSAKSNGVDLDLKIFEQLNVAKNAIEVLPSNLSDAIISQSNSVETAYTEVQRCIIYTKSDMPSALGIMITYQDNDGD